MRRMVVALAVLGCVLGLLGLGHSLHRESDPLPSWNVGGSKLAIIAFVDRVARDGSPEFVKPQDRIAVFDNDGTLWCEQPVYVQLAFAIDRVRELAPQHPEWKDQEPFKSVLAGDTKGLEANGEKGLVEILAVTHAGITTDEFNEVVKEWVRTWRHPKLGKSCTELAYQPMLEVMQYLRANGFRTYIVSGGGVEFMRAFTEQAYGVPPEQVIGSSGKTQFELQAGKPVLMKLAEVDFVNDGPGKPVGIQKFIGRRPLMAFGNSDGDLQMLQWTTGGDGARLGVVVHHTDGEREYAYDRQSYVGKLDKALDEAASRAWTVVDMKKDWKEVFPSHWPADD